MAGMGTHLATERVRLVTPRLQLARPEFYPNPLRGGAGHHPGASNARVRQRSSEHLAVLLWSTAKAGGAMSFRDESRGKPDWVGVNASERLSFARFGKASRGKPRRKPESRNSTFRDCRGGLGKRGHGGNVNPPRNRKSEDGNPPPTTGATELYPDHVRICGRLGVKFPGPTRRGQQ